MRVLGVFLAAIAAILIFTGCETVDSYRVTLQSPPGPPPPPPPPPPPGDPHMVAVRDARRAHGPPPHAPAHGYRRMHEGYELVYDEGIQCYSITGQRDYFYRDGMFFRFGGSGWEVSAHIGGNDVHWVRTEEQRVPERLVVKYKGKGHGRDGDDDRDDDHGKGKGKGQGKGHDKDRGKGHDKHGDHDSMSAPSLPAPIMEARFGKY